MSRNQQSVCPLKPPYAADTRAKGWRFELDYEKIDQSDTWSIAAEIPFAQPALLMMWLAAWKQEPCGSLPNDENVIRAKCRIPAKAWPSLRDVLLRGWALADDGRLYHPTVTARVLEMVEYRAQAAGRKAAYREQMRASQSSPTSVPRDSHGKNDTGTGTGTGTKEKERDARATRLPAPFVLESEWREWAVKTRPDLDPDLIAAKFADFWHSKPGKDGRKLDWLATWRNWVREERAPKAGPADVARATVPADPRNLFVPPPRMTPEERAASDTARRLAMSAVKNITKVAA